MTSPNRWIIALAGLVIEIAFGAIYAWSVFSLPLSTGFGWTISQVTLTFEIAILVLGFVSFLGGFWLKQIDPRVIALAGGFLFGAGFFLASFAAHGLWVLYVSVGLISGIGLGIGYIIPIAVLVRWFPDRRALISGIVVCGFGAGALVTAPVATRLIESVGALWAFADLGIAFLVITTGCGLLMRNPPPDWKPANWQPNPRQVAQAALHDFDLRGALRTWQWWALAAILFLNVALGVSLISEEDPIFQALGHVSPEVAGSLVGIAALGNAFGRVFWAWVSDFLTRRITFSAIFVIEAVLFALFPTLHGTAALATAAFLILACFGGSVGTMPSFVADCFGPLNVGAIYGAMLTAWGLGTVFGSSLLAEIHQHFGSYELALYILAVVALVSAILPLAVRPPGLPRIEDGLELRRVAG
ncbi:MAG: OFA family MFS transporter [Acetobacteraceae bacterium]